MPDHILIVDDEPFNLDTLSQDLEDLGYVTNTAVDGPSALQMIDNDPPDCLLLDIMMPGMDGFEVLRRLRSNKNFAELPVIIISAATDSENVIRGITLGAEDYLPKPYNPTLLKARLGNCLARKHLRDIEKKYLQTLEDEMQVARQIQSCFLPAEIPAQRGWDVAMWLRSCKEVAGDFYDVFEVPNGGTILFVGDVCGKGVGAALFMTLFRSMLHAQCMETARSPEELLVEAVRFTNGYVSSVHERDNMFATLFIAYLPEEGDVVYINCGNEPAMLLSDGEHPAHLLMPTGPALGIFGQANFVAKTVPANGGTFLAYTDGLTDALGEDGRPCGRDKASGWLDPKLAPDQQMAILQEKLEEYTLGKGYIDDITVAIFKPGK